jgi:hypothetical protein
MLHDKRIERLHDRIEREKLHAGKEKERGRKQGKERGCKTGDREMLHRKRKKERGCMDEKREILHGKS